ncbi:MAG: NAD-dependent epimerase/dehydratase family protein [Lachnospiraceae bacterium]|nr:NAD-dependent epimerase/dehydratase family protein [Lachnospiraceae bacterium]
MNLLESKLYIEDLDRIEKTIDLDYFSNSSILITGGLGLICSSIVDLLADYELKKKKNIRIFVAARNRAAFEEKYGNIPCVEFIEYNALKENHFPTEIDYIIHGAGVASPDRYIDSPVETMMTNINGIYELLEYSRSNSVKRIVFISSSEVYGAKTSAESYLEEDYGFVNIDLIRSSYPESKRAAEVLCRSFHSEYGVDVVIVRPGHIFGPSAGKNDNRVSSSFAYQAAKGEDLILKSSGLQNRSYMYAPDCAKAIITVLMKGKSGEAYNVGSQTITTIREMAESYAKAGGVSLSAAEPTKEELKAFNPMNNAALNIEKLLELGYQDTFSVEEGFSHTVKIIKND